MELEPILSKIKKEQDCDNGEQLQEAMGLSILTDQIEIKSELNYLIETECKKNSGIKCECIKCICKAESIDPMSTDSTWGNKKVKLEENIDNTNILQNDNAHSISDSYLRPTEFVSVSSIGQEYLGSEIKTEKQCDANIPDPQTGEMVQLKQLSIPLLDCDKMHGAMGLSTFTDHVEVQSESDLNNYLMKTECKKNFGVKCECIKCIFKVESIDSISSDSVCDDVVKLEEINDHKNVLLNNNASLSSNSYLRPTELVSVSSEIKIEKQFEKNVQDVVLDPQTGEMVLLKHLLKQVLLVNLKPHGKFVNSDKCFNGNGTATSKLIPVTYDCPKCNKRFAEEFSRDSHVTNCHNDDESLLKTDSSKTYNCLKCNKQFSTKGFLYRHMIRNHSDDKNLTLTAKPKGNPEAATSKLIPVTYHCPKCNKRFAEEFSRISHITNCHNDDKSLLKTISSKKYNCPKCNKQFFIKSTFHSHLMRYHSDDKELLKMISTPLHVCPKCKKYFGRKCSLDGHIISVHQDDENLLKIVTSETNVCPKCNKQLVTKTKLYRHIISNHSDDKNLTLPAITKTYECPKCNKRCTTKYRFEAHLVSKHNDDQDLLKTISRKIYDCPNCSKQFTKKYTLECHIVRNHNADKNLMKTISRKIYECPNCRKQFTKKYTLESHIVTSHNADRNLLKTVSCKIYDCPKCSRQFTKKYSLEKHIFGYHSNDKSLLKTLSNKIYDCPKCSKQFITKSLFNIHVGTWHVSNQKS